MNGYPPPHGLVVIGASAGGVGALEEVIAGLPADLPAAVCVTIHLAPDTSSMLAPILARAGLLPARAASDGEPLQPGEILVAPPGHHLLVADGTAHLTLDARENGHRPAIDVLLRSAAQAYGPRAVGVILSGVLDDGTAGLAAIKAAGGATVAQDPADALFGQLPASAISAVDVDAIVPAAQIPRVVTDLVRGSGLLHEDAHAPVPQWRCGVGHRYSAASLADAQGNAVEDTVWGVIRSLEDRSKLLERMAAQQSGSRREAAARYLRQRARQVAQHAETVRALQERVTTTAPQPLGTGVADPTA